MSRTSIRSLVLAVTVLLASLGGASLAGAPLLHSGASAHVVNVADGGTPPPPPII